MKVAKFLFIFIVPGIAQVSTGARATPPTHPYTQEDIPAVPPAPSMRQGTRATQPRPDNLENTPVLPPAPSMREGTRATQPQSNNQENTPAMPPPIMREGTRATSP